MEREPFVEAVHIPTGAVYGGKLITRKSARIFRFRGCRQSKCSKIQKLSVYKLREKAFCGSIGVEMSVATNRLV
jgi:hypothetical protein